MHFYAYNNYCKIGGGSTLFIPPGSAPVSASLSCRRLDTKLITTNLHVLAHRPSLLDKLLNTCNVVWALCCHTHLIYKSPGPRIYNCIPILGQYSSLAAMKSELNSIMDKTKYEYTIDNIHYSCMYLIHVCLS